MKTIDMKSMRYINLLDKISHVKTKTCFIHNNTIFFAVDKKDVSKAIGPGAANVKKLQASLGAKIKIIKKLEGLHDAKRYIEDIVSPLKIKSIDVQDNCLIITAGNNQTKATLFGRNKKRYFELKQIIQNDLNLDLKIV